MSEHAKRNLSRAYNRLAPILFCLAFVIVASFCWDALAAGGIRAEKFNVSAPGANTDILSDGITPGKDGKFEITVALTTSSVFNASVTDGTTTHVWGLASSSALSAGDLHTFEFDVSNGLEYNFQVETDGVIEQLIVREVH